VTDRPIDLQSHVRAQSVPLSDRDGFGFSGPATPSEGPRAGGSGTGRTLLGFRHGPSQVVLNCVEGEDWTVSLSPDRLIAFVGCTECTDYSYFQGLARSRSSGRAVKL
jgi:hypothetical protein